MAERRMKSWRFVLITILLAAAILSVTVLSSVFSSPKFYSKTIRALDEQKNTVTTLSISVAAASTALSAIPNDTASPIANELADLSLPLFIITSFLLMEKFLLTTFGWVAFTFLVPLACVFGCICVYRRNEVLLAYIRKLLILTLALILIIPVSTRITTQVKDTFSESVSLAFSEIDGFSDEMNTEDAEKGNAFVKFFSNLKDDVVSLVETAKNLLGIFTDAISVLLITCFVIPVLSALLFIWVIKLVFSVNIPVRQLVKIDRPAPRRLPKAKKEDPTKPAA